jgi:hypothetical protein
LMHKAINSLLTNWSAGVSNISFNNYTNKSMHESKVQKQAITDLPKE